MCGLFGFAVTPNFNRQRDLYDMLAYFASYRGTHSWGLTLDHGDAVTTLRGLGDITEAKSAQQAVRGARACLGHTRLATVGDISLQNCHPFDIKGILVAHNGGIWNHAEMARRDGRVYTVDSQALAWRVALNRDIDDLEGYGAVSWFDTHSRTLRVGRMSMGDLEMFVLRDRKTAAIAHVYISDSAAIAKDGLDLEEVCELLDFEVCDTFIPAETVVYQIHPDRFEREPKRRLELAARQWTRSYSHGSYWGSDYSTSDYTYNPPSESICYAYIDEEGDTILVRDLKWNDRAHAKDPSKVQAMLKSYVAVEWDETGVIMESAESTSFTKTRIRITYQQLDMAFQQGPQRYSNAEKARTLAEGPLLVEDTSDTPDPDDDSLEAISKAVDDIIEKNAAKDVA